MFLMMFGRQRERERERERERVGTLLYVIFSEITFWGVVADILHKMGIYTGNCDKIGEKRSNLNDEWHGNF